MKKSAESRISESQVIMKKKTKKKNGFWRTFSCVFLLIVFLGIVAGAIFILPYSRATMDLSLLSLGEEGTPTVLLVADEQGHPCHGAVAYSQLTEIQTGSLQRQIIVSYEEIPQALCEAFIAIEDKRFYQHRGVDVVRTLHAAWSYVTNRGQAEFGGSGITQQLVKNLTGNTERTAERKLTEIFSALDLEKKVSKEKILETYMNVINLGSGCIGVGAAAQVYFGKSVQELTLVECAAIAAITNNPTRYNPRTHPEENRKRRNLILSEMLSQGYITNEAYTSAVQESPLLCQEPDLEERMTGWYEEMVIQDVLRDLQDRLGYSRETAMLLLLRGGLVIETSMNSALQTVLEDYYEDTTNFPIGVNGRPQSSAMIIDPYSGEILAVTGAIGDKQAYYLQNYATQTKRPAGSVIKPLGVYAPALAEGLITWSTVFEDAPSETHNGRPWPKNADGLYRGRVTVRDALSESLNTVPIKILQELGLQTAFDFLRNDLHMKSLLPASEGNAHDMTLSSVALGQQSGGVTVRELTAAYTVFTEGIYRAPVSYRRVLDGDGRVLLENDCAGERVLSEAEASLMTRLLETVTQDGTAQGLTLKEEGMAVAGKTGTTQNNCDRWFVGYTPRLLCGIWMGYDYPQPLDGIVGNPCLTIFDDVMTTCERVYTGRPVKNDFDRDPTVIPMRICPLSGEIATPDCDASLGEHRLPDVGWFIEGTEPRDACHLHFFGWQENESSPDTHDEQGSEQQTEPWDTEEALESETNSAAGTKDPWHDRPRAP